MSTRRIVCALLGMWIGASVFMGAVAAFSFRLVNQLITQPGPELAPYFKLLGEDRLRLLARHQAAEFNRALFEGWGLTQILLGILIFGILLFGTKEGKAILGVSLFMALLATGMHLLLTPSIVGYGRALDFVSADKELDVRKRVGAFHTAYSTLEGVKLVCGLGLLIVLSREKSRRGNFPVEAA
jgi:hypothetical protein